MTGIVFQVTGKVIAQSQRQAGNFLEWLSEFKDPDNGAHIQGALKPVSGIASGTTTPFPAEGDRVKILAGMHLGQIGQVVGVDASDIVPIKVTIDVPTDGGNTAQYVEHFRPEEVEIQVSETEPRKAGSLVDLNYWEPGENVDADDQVREELQGYRDKAAKAGAEPGPDNYVTAIGIALDNLVLDIDLRDRIDTLTQQIADELDRKDREAKA